MNPITVPGGGKGELNISLPFMGKYSNEIKKKISRLSSNILINTKVNIIWNFPRKFRNLFLFKDKLPMRIRSNILYRFTCNGCNSIYLGKTKRKFLVRAFEHLGVSLRTGKKYTYSPNNNNNLTILQHLHRSEECNGELNDFEIIGKAKK